MNCTKLSACKLLILLFCFSCNNAVKKQPQSSYAANDSGAKRSYAYDAGFLKKHTHRIIELQNDEGSSKLLASADFEGRVMTSTATGDTGMSYGWLNYDLIASG
jgi:hypothetical protein